MELKILVHHVGQKHIETTEIKHVHVNLNISMTVQMVSVKNVLGDVRNVQTIIHVLNVQNTEQVLLVSQFQDILKNLVLKVLQLNVFTNVLLVKMMTKNVKVVQLPDTQITINVLVMKDIMILNLANLLVINVILLVKHVQVENSEDIVSHVKIILREKQFVRVYNIVYLLMDFMKTHQKKNLKHVTQLARHVKDSLETNV